MLLLLLCVEMQRAAVFCRQRHDVAAGAHAVFVQDHLCLRGARAAGAILFLQKHSPCASGERRRQQHGAQDDGRRSAGQKQRPDAKQEGSRQRAECGKKALRAAAAECLRLLRVLPGLRGKRFLGKTEKDRRAGRRLRRRRLRLGERMHLRAQKIELPLKLRQGLGGRKALDRFFGIGTARGGIRQLARGCILFLKCPRGLTRPQSREDCLKVLLLFGTLLALCTQSHVALMEAMDLIERVFHLLKLHQRLRQKPRPVVAAAISPVAERFLRIGEADGLIACRDKRRKPLFKLCVRRDCDSALTDEGAALQDALPHAKQQLTAVFTRHACDGQAAFRLIGAEFAHRDAALCAALDGDVPALPFQLYFALQSIP